MERERNGRTSKEFVSFFSPLLLLPFSSSLSPSHAKAHAKTHCLCLCLSLVYADLLPLFLRLVWGDGESRLCASSLASRAASASLLAFFRFHEILRPSDRRRLQS